MQGWIKLHRCLMYKPIWLESTPEQKVILITLLTMANHTGKEWEWRGERYTAAPGQFITSLDSIAHKCGKGITMQNVRTALKRFEKYEFLTNESTNKNRLITIVNWGIYQGLEDDPNKQTNMQLTSNQQATNKQLTTNKNDKNNKNDKENTSRHKYDICDMENAEYLLNEILQNNPTYKKPNLKKWAEEFRLIRERDNRTDKQVKYLIKWSQHHEFWKTVILSPSKFRKQFDHMVVKATAEHEAKHKSKTIPKKEDFNLDDE